MPETPPTHGEWASPRHRDALSRATSPAFLSASDVCPVYTVHLREHGCNVSLRRASPTRWRGSVKWDADAPIAPACRVRLVEAHCATLCSAVREVRAALSVLSREASR